MFNSIKRFEQLVAKTDAIEIKFIIIVFIIIIIVIIIITSGHF